MENIIGSVPRCIFCKLSNVTFNSIEHIIPESFGNNSHILPKGVVCDNCNNYFAIKIERYILNSPAILNIRSTMRIPNKKGRIISSIEKYTLPEYRMMSRFLGKIGLEMLAEMAIKHNVLDWEKEVIDKVELDELRQFVRYDKGEWPFGFRLLHPVNAIFFDEKEHYELLHEYDLLYTSGLEMYAIVSLFGVEFSLNLGGPFVDGYQKWLEANNYASPLYVGRNAL